MNFRKLRNKNCLITGGSGIIGTAICEELARKGINIAILDINKDATDTIADALITEYGIKAISCTASVLNRAQLEQVKIKVNAELGHIHFLINAAGGNSPMATTSLEFLDESNISELDKSFYGLNEEGFDAVFDLNFKGTLLPTLVFTKDMLEEKSGVVINISSMNAFRPLTKIPAYSAAKAAVNNFTQWLAVHLAKTGIRVNAIAPGFLLTRQNQFLLIDEKTGEMTPRGKKIIAHTPMGKYGELDDISGTIMYLLSDMSKFVTGVVIPVDGGFNAYSGV